MAWALKVTILAEIPLLSQTPKLGDVDIQLRSLRRQSYIRMTVRTETPAPNPRMGT